MTHVHNIFACTRVKSHKHKHTHTSSSHTCPFKKMLLMPWRLNNALSVSLFSVLCWSDLNAKSAGGNWRLRVTVKYKSFYPESTYFDIFDPFLSPVLFCLAASYTLPSAYFIFPPFPFSHCFSQPAGIWVRKHLWTCKHPHVNIAPWAWTCAIQLTTTEYVWPNLWPSIH